MPVTISTSAADLTSIQAPLLILPLAQGGLPTELAELDSAVGGVLSRCLTSGDFTGKRDDTALLYPGGGKLDRILLVGLGESSGVDASALRRAAMIGGKRARVIGVPSLAMAFIASQAPGVDSDRAGQCLAEGVPFGAWHYPDLKRPPETPLTPLTEGTLISVGGDQQAFARGTTRGAAIAEGQTLTRWLQFLPGNTCTPAFLAEQAEAIAQRYDLGITVMDGAEIEAAGMHALMSVAKGSAVDPRFIALEYRGSEDAPLVLIGKGITFDSGGISIKPAQAMEDMKYDMSGAAAVLGTFETLGKLKPPVHVIGLIASCENLPSGSSYKPGDVIGSHFGKTIEVINTDAEGRLVLADALSWARRYHPAAVINCATLTGAIVIGLGHFASGVMGTDPALISAVIAAGEASGERCWELPLWDEYRDLMKSEIADVKNAGGRAAGSITAGWFLREFVDGYPWAHIDIAGTAWTDGEMPIQVKGPTGVLVRLFTELVLART